MIAGVILFLVFPLAMAGVVYTLRHWASLAALLAVGAAFLVGMALLTWPLDQPVTLFGRQIAMGDEVVFLGRELVIERSDQMALAFLFLTSSGLFALAWRVAPRSLIFPVGLSVLSLFSAALLIRPLVYAALFVEIAAVLSIFALQSEDRPPTRGGLHYLVFTTLAMPGLLVTHWLMERYSLTPDDTALLNTSTILLAISFSLLLGNVPFHTWVPALAGDSAPMASAFVLTVGNGAVWFLLFDFLETYAGLSTYPRFDSLVSTAGLAMIVVGGLLAAAQRRLGRLIGYSALVDTGGGLVALGMHNELGLSLLFLLLLVRPFGIILLATGVSGLQRLNGGDDSLDALRGKGREAPWSVVALVVGGLSIAGMPVSAGFAGRWALYRALAPTGPGSALLILFAGIGSMIGLWRGLSTLLAPVDASQEESEESADERSAQEPPWDWRYVALLVLSIVLCIGIGLFPHVLTPIASQLVESYTFFAP